MEHNIKWMDPVQTPTGALTGNVMVKNGQSHFLHSSVDPEQEARDWVNQIELTDNTAYLVLGFGLGYHVRYLLQVLPENCRVYVVENSTKDNTLQFALKMIPGIKEWQEQRLDFYFGPNFYMMASFISENMRKHQIKRITTCRHYPSMQIYPEFYEKIDKDLVVKVEELYSINMDFSLGASMSYLTNTWKNLPYIWSSPGTTMLKEKLKGMPAIVISSGPSLDKNIKQLKNYTDKAILIASGSALGACAKHGITPHFLVVVDPQPIMHKVLAKDYNEQTVLMSAYEAYHEIGESYPGFRIYCKQGQTNTLKTVMEFLPETEELNCSMSVATLAFDLALKIGANPIVFVGQDLAFTETEEQYATGCKSAIGGPKDFENMPDNDIRYVKGWQGQNLKTAPIFETTLEYFKLRFSCIKDTTIINATEGGAYIDGISHMKLKEAAKKYFKHKKDIFKTIHQIAANHMPKQYSEIRSSLEILAKEIKDVDDKLAMDLSDILAISKDVRLDELTEVEKSIERMRGCIEDVKQSPIYEYVQSAIDPFLEIFLYHKREGMSNAEEFALYYHLIGHIIYVLEEFYSHVMDGWQTIQKIWQRYKQNEEITSV